MSFEQLWGIGFLTVLAFALLAGLFYLKRALRNRLFPEERVRDRGEAMAELLLLQAQLEKKAGGETTSGGGRETRADSLDLGDGGD